VYKYIVQLPLEPGALARWFTVATCLTPANAAECVRILLENQEDVALVVRVERIWFAKE
jgi:hypothetical protein